MTKHATLIVSISLLLFAAFLVWCESNQHIACINAGGIPTLGWFLDGCDFKGVEND